MRVCVIYDCLYPYTVGGGERWYRNLAERLAAAGHDVTYLTLRQWPRGAAAAVPGVRVVAVGPRMSLYTAGGRRRVLPPLVFGAGVLVHLLARGRRYDVVHVSAFPYFSLLAAAAARPFRRYRLVVDWLEVWSGEYWRKYLGSVGGAIGDAVQTACLRVPQLALCFSRLHERRLREHGVRGPVTLLPGAYVGPLEPTGAQPADDFVVYAGRHIPEKRVPAVVTALAHARRSVDGLRGIVFGDGPERGKVLALRSSLGLEQALEAPGFVDANVVDDALRRATCMILPSSREGYGMVVMEAARHGTPSVVVDGPDNAAVELLRDGVNGAVAASASPEDLGEAIVRVHRAGEELRASTRRWFADHAPARSLESSVRLVVDHYRELVSARS